MSRIMETWAALQREATAPDYDTQQYALFQVALVLERHSAPNPDADYYADHLSRDLLRLVLDARRQRDTVDMLVGIVRANLQQSASAFYALSKATPDVMAQPLLQLLKAVGKKLPPNAAYEAVQALDAVIKTETDATQAALAQHQVGTWLERWIDAEDERLSIKAEHVHARWQQRIGAA